MSRETIIHNIENITSDAIIEFFDQLMALCCLYDALGCDKIYITMNSDQSFDIILDSQESASTVYNRINGLHIKLYDIMYKIESSFDNNIVHILLLTPGKV